MRYPIVIVCEPGRTLADLLRSRLAKRDFELRQVTDPPECRETAALFPNPLLVLDVSSNAERMLDLLDWNQTMHRRPDTVVVLRHASNELGELAWELGATCVLGQESWHAELPAVVDGLINARWNQLEAKRMP